MEEGVEEESRSEMQQLLQSMSALTTEMAAMQTEVTTEMAALRTDMYARFAQIGDDIGIVRRDV